MKKHKNRENAWRFFYPEGDGKAKSGYCLHHTDQSLRHNDPERYEEWRPEDLVMMTISEHVKMHKTGCVLSDETKLKIGSKNKGNKNCLGRVVSDETKQKIREKKLGTHLSEEQKRKISEKMRGTRVGEKNPMFGKHHSEDARLKMREAHSNIDISGEKHPMFGKHHSEETRRKMSEAQKRRYKREHDGVK